MKILKYKKLSSNKYEVILENEKLKLYDDTIIKYELLQTKEIKEELYNEIIEYNSCLESYYKTIKYIEKKLRTETEIKKYLEKDYSKESITKTIERLKREGYINRELYLKCFLDDKINLTLNGPNKIKKDLLKLGYSDSEITEALENIGNEIWINKINKIINKKITQNKNLGLNKLKEKIIYDLANNGYYKWMIYDCLNNVELKDNNDILEKEYNKQYNKLSRKYNGEELFYEIKRKLYQKGFQLDNIQELIAQKKNF